MPSSPSPLDPCELWPADQQDVSACESCPLAKCLYERERPGRPITAAGARARALLAELAGLSVAELGRRSGLSKSQAWRVRRAADARQ